MHHHFEQYGLPLGTSTILASAMLDFAATHGLSVVSVLGILLGTAINVGTFVIRVDTWWRDRKKERPK